MVANLHQWTGLFEEAVADAQARAAQIAFDAGIGAGVAARTGEGGAFAMAPRNIPDNPGCGT